MGRNIWTLDNSSGGVDLYRKKIGGILAVIFSSEHEHSYNVTELN